MTKLALYPTLVLHPTQTAQWHALVSDAQDICTQQLDEHLESYLVFLLMRFLARPEIAGSILGLEFLESLQSPEHDKLRQEKLREVGDKCLLFAGLFPQHAERRRVKISYFVNTGQNAYANLSALLKENSPSLYSALCEGFVSMMDVLQAVRSMADDHQDLSPIQAEELYRETGSQRALEMLRHHTNATPLFDLHDGLLH